MKHARMTIWLAVLVVLSFSGALFGAIPSRVALEEFWQAGEECSRNVLADNNKDLWDEFRKVWDTHRVADVQTHKKDLLFWLEESDQVFAKASEDVKGKEAKTIIAACAKLRKAAIVFVVCYDGGSGRPASPLLAIVQDGVFFPSERSHTAADRARILARAITVRAFDDAQTAYAELQKLLIRSTDKARYEAGLAIFWARGKDYKAKYWEVTARTFKKCPSLSYDSFFGHYFCLSEFQHKPRVNTIGEWRGYFLTYGDPQRVKTISALACAQVAYLFCPASYNPEVTREDFAEIWKRSAIELKRLVILDPAEDNFECWRRNPDANEPSLLMKVPKLDRRSHTLCMCGGNCKRFFLDLHPEYCEEVRQLSQPLSCYVNGPMANGAFKVRWPSPDGLSIVEEEINGRSREQLIYELRGRSMARGMARLNSRTMSEREFYEEERVLWKRISAAQYEELKEKQEIWLQEHPGSNFAAKQSRCREFGKEVEECAAREATAERNKKEKDIVEKQQQGGGLTSAVK